MRYLILLSLAFVGLSLHAQNVTVGNDLVFSTIGGDHYTTTGGTDNLTIQTGGGLNLLSSFSVQIEAGGDGSMLLSTANTSDIDIEAGGNVVLYPQAGNVVVGGAGLQFMMTLPQPTCDLAAQGTVFYVAGGTGVADQLQVCMKSAGDTYSWVTK